MYARPVHFLISPAQRNIILTVAVSLSLLWFLSVHGIESAFAGPAAVRTARDAKSDVAVRITEVLKQNIGLLEALAAEAKQKGDNTAATVATQTLAALKVSLAQLEGVPPEASLVEVPPPKPKEVNIRSTEMQKLKGDYLKERNDFDTRRLAKLKEMAKRFLTESEADLSAKQRAGNISGIAIATKAVEIGKSWIEQLDTSKEMTVPADVRRELKEKVNAIVAKKKEIDEDCFLALENLEIRYLESFTQKAKAQGVEELDDEKLKTLFRQLVGVPAPTAIASVTPAEKVPAETPATGDKSTSAPARSPQEPTEISRSGDATDWIPLAKWFAEVSNLMVLNISVLNRNRLEEQEETDVLGGTCKTKFEPIRVIPLAEGCIFRAMSIPGNEPVEIIEWPRKVNKWTLQIRVKPGTEIPSKHAIELQVSASSAKLLHMASASSTSDEADTSTLASDMPPVGGVKVRITTDPPGAFVYVNGVLYREATGIPQTPCNVVMVPGTNNLILKKPGYVDGAISKFEAKEGAQVTWTFTRDPAYVDKVVKIDSLRSWQPSGIEVKQGDSITLEVSGMWSCGSGREKVGAEGYPNDEKYFKYYLDPKSSPRQIKEANYGALLMRIGKSGQIRVVSQNMKIKADVDGVISFDINEADDDKARRDNAGALNVRIVKIPSKR